MNKLENDILNSKLRILRAELVNKEIFKNRNITESNQIPFTFVVYTLQRFLSNYNIEEVIEEITEGGNDQNIDIFNIDEESSTGDINVNLFQVKYKSETNLNQTIGSNDVQAFINKVQKIIINADISNYPLNSYLKNKFEEFIDICKGSDGSNIKINLFLVTNGSNLNDLEINELNKFKDEYSVVNKFIVLNDYNFFIDKPEKEISDVKIKISDDIIKMNHNISACIVSFKTYELAKLYESFKDRILEKNVRKLVGGEINKNIATSLLSDPKMFWYKNNGLSIVCRRWEDKTVGGDTVLTLENPYIVNGGQTTKTIYNLFKEREDSEEQLLPFHKSYVMARIYQTTDDDQITAIVRGTNNQNKITLYDLKSTNENLKKIKAFFDTKEVSLLIQRNVEEEKKPKAINSDLLLQVYCAIYKSIPHKSKISKNKLIKDYYDDVYSNPSIHNDLLNSFYLYEYVRKENKCRSQQHLSHSMYSVLYIMGCCEVSLKESFAPDIAIKAYNKSVGILDEIVQRQQDENYSNHNFFKSEKSTNEINNYLKSLKIVDSNVSVLN